jgi:hypothetical protein
VPFGLRGTIVGFSEDSLGVEVVFDAPFLGGDALRGRCTDGRGKLLSAMDLYRVPTRTKLSAVRLTRTCSLATHFLTQI